MTTTRVWTTHTSHNQMHSASMRHAHDFIQSLYWDHPDWLFNFFKIRDTDSLKDIRYAGSCSTGAHLTGVSGVNLMPFRLCRAAVVPPCLNGTLPSHNNATYVRTDQCTVMITAPLPQCITQQTREDEREQDVAKRKHHNSIARAHRSSLTLLWWKCSEKKFM